MFEQSLAVSDAGRVSTGTRWTWFGSLGLQMSIAAMLVMLPMLHPERMTLSGSAPKAIVPLVTVKQPEVKVKARASSSAVVPSVVVVEAVPSMLAPPTIPRGISAEEPAPMSPSGALTGMGMGSEVASVIAGTGGGAPVAVAVRREARGPMRVSSGVGAGMLLTPIRPAYPAIARAAHVGGTVVAQAVISREGRIEEARVLSGPAMLASAALEAVRTARYSAYRLNGQAVEVETTVTVNFRLGGE